QELRAAPLTGKRHPEIHRPIPHAPGHAEHASQADRVGGERGLELERWEIAGEWGVEVEFAFRGEPGDRECGQRLAGGGNVEGRLPGHWPAGRDVRSSETPDVS